MSDPWDRPRPPLTRFLPFGLRLSSCGGGHESRRVRAIGPGLWRHCRGRGLAASRAGRARRAGQLVPAGGTSRERRGHPYPQRALCDLLRRARGRRREGSRPLRPVAATVGVCGGAEHYALRFYILQLRLACGHGGFEPDDRPSRQIPAPGKGARGASRRPRRGRFRCRGEPGAESVASSRSPSSDAHVAAVGAVWPWPASQDSTACGTPKTTPTPCPRMTSGCCAKAAAAAPRTSCPAGGRTCRSRRPTPGTVRAALSATVTGKTSRS